MSTSTTIGTTENTETSATTRQRSTTTEMVLETTVDPVIVSIETEKVSVGTEKVSVETVSVSETTELVTTSLMEVKCERTDLSKAPINGYYITDGGLTTIFKIGSQIEFKCDTGYKSDITYTECLENGTWSNKEPRCKGKSQNIEKNKLEALQSRA